jgi:hypothetical protein
MSEPHRETQGTSPRAEAARNQRDGSRRTAKTPSQRIAEYRAATAARRLNTILEARKATQEA